MRESDLEHFRVVAGRIKQGSLADFKGDSGIIIGTGLAESLGLKVGDEITLLAAQGVVTPFGTAPRVKAYPVLATFEIGMSEYDASFIFMPFEEAQLYFNMENGASALEIMVDDPDAVEVYRGLIAAQLVGHVLRVIDWREHEPKLLLGAGGRAQCHVLDPHAHHSGRRAQYHFGSHHAREGQVAGDRDPAHHGREPGRR